MTKIAKPYQPITKDPKGYRKPPKIDFQTPRPLLTPQQRKTLFKHYYRLFRPYCWKKGKVIFYHYTNGQLLRREPRYTEAMKQLYALGYTFQWSI